MSETQELAPQPNAAAMIGFGDSESFKHVQRVAKLITSSNLVPENFRGESNIGNAVIALNMATRMGADAMAVMQNIYVVHGKPSWSSQFIIACVNSCGKFSPLRYKIRPLGKKTVEYEYTRYVGGEKRREKGTLIIEDKECIAWAVEKATGEPLEGPPITIETAVKEGWFTKPDSKWKTMPDLMLRYRAATFFGRLYSPELLMGMRTSEEIIDVETVVAPADSEPKSRVAEPKLNVPEIVAKVSQAMGRKSPEELAKDVAEEEAEREEAQVVAAQPSKKKLAAIRTLLKANSLEESALIALMVANGQIEESLTTLDAVHEVAPEVINFVFENFSTITAALTVAEKGGQ